MGQSFKNFFTSEVTITSDVFCSFMLNRNMSKVDRGLIITKKGYVLKISNVEVFKQAYKPCDFKGSRRESSIFRLRGILGDGGLLLGLPANERIA